MIVGASSGFLVFLARMSQKGLFQKILKSIYDRNSLLTVTNNQDSVTNQEFINTISGMNIDTYSSLFERVTAKVMISKAVIDILIGLSNVYEKLNCDISTSKNKYDHKEWNFSIQSSTIKKYSIVHYNVWKFKKIIDFCKFSYFDILTYILCRSLDVEKNIHDMDSRCKNIGGRSGAFFYYTANKQFILKTVNSHEITVLKSMINEYTERITSNLPSFITKILGAF